MSRNEDTKTRGIKAFTLPLATVLVALLALFTVAEIGLRVLQRVQYGIPITSLLPGYRETRFPLSPFLVFGPRVDWQIEGTDNPRGAYFNRQGFRTTGQVGPKRPGELRVIALGGSTTENVWNRAGVHWPGVLEEELAAAGLDVTVLNGAMSAYTTAHSTVRYLTDVIEYDPDVVILMHNINDLAVTYFAAQAERAPDPSYLVKYGTKEFTSDLDERDVVMSRLLRFLTGVIRGPAGAQPALLEKPYDLDPGRGLFRRNLLSFVALVRASGAEAVLLTMPSAGGRALYEESRTLAPPLPEHGRFLEDFETFNDVVRDLEGTEGAHVVDMAARLSGQDELFMDVVHYNESGTRAFGAALAEALAPLVRDLAGPT